MATPVRKAKTYTDVKKERDKEVIKQTVAKDMHKGLTFEDVAKMRRGVNTVDVREYPGLEGVLIGFRVITQREAMVAGAKAEKRAIEVLQTPTMQQVEPFYWHQYIFMASSAVPVDQEFSDSAYIVDDIEELQPFFNDIEEVENLPPAEIKYLYQFFTDVQNKYSPNAEEMTEERFEKLLEDLKKKSPRGMSTSTEMLTRLAHFLAENMTKSPKDNGYIFSLANESSTSKNNEQSTQPKKFESENNSNQETSIM